MPSPFSLPSHSVVRGHLWPAALACLIAVSPRPAAAFLNFFWTNPVNGSVDDPSKWTPTGIPTFADNLRFEQPGGPYTVTFPGTVPTSTNLICLNGNVTWTMASPHTTSGITVDLPSGAASLTMNAGVLNCDNLVLGFAGHLANMTMTNAGALTTGAIIHSKGINGTLSPTFGDQIGHDGICELDVFGGAHYYSDQVGSSWPLMIGVTSGAAATLDVSGLSVGPTHFSGLTVGTNGMIVGVSGVANVFAVNGGTIDCAGDIIIARDPTSDGYFNVGPVSGLGTSSLTAGGDLLIGNNGIGPEAGHGELIVKNRSFVNVTGHVVVGDPDDTVDPQSVLRVQQGGTMTATNGLRVWPTAGVALDLQGGVTKVTGGQLRWPANKTLLVSSSTGTPELWISNHDTNIAPSTVSSQSELTVGNAAAGVGTFYVTGASTVFPMGPGAMVVGNLAGSTGTVVVDTSATLSASGPVGGAINIGGSGNGTLNVLGGSLVDVGTAAVGVAAGAVGNVHVSGSGSRLRLRDNMWVGGGFGGAGGTGVVTVDNFGTLEIDHVNGVNPALATIYSPGGTLLLSSAGTLTTTGTLDTRGLTTLDGGLVIAQSINIPSTGTFGGQGVAQLTVGIGTNGRLDPHTSSDPIGQIAVTGSLSQFTLGHYVVDLGAIGNPSPCDLMTFTSTATLDGTLDIRTTPSFVGHGGDIFTVLTCSSRTGTFANVTWNGGPLGTHGAVDYQPNGVRIIIPSQTGVEAMAGVTELSFASAGSRSNVSFALGLPKSAEVDAKLYDVTGREVSSLFAGSLGAGRHTLTPTSTPASGVYFARATIRFEGKTVVRTARTVLVR